MLHLRQDEFSDTGSVGKKPVMSSYHTCPLSKGNDAFTLFVGQHLVIDEPNLLCQDGLQQGAVISLLFDGMRKEKVRLLGDQLVNGYFFHPHQNSAIRQIFLHGYTQCLVFGIRITAAR